MGTPDFKVGDRVITHFAPDRVSFVHGDGTGMVEAMTQRKILTLEQAHYDTVKIRFPTGLYSYSIREVTLYIKPTILIKLNG